jgi:hypothetical protein
MLFQIKSYLKFLWHSKNEHAVHSPFVFNLLTKCFYDKKFKSEYIVLKNYRNELLQNKNTINVTDFGAGSRVFKSNSRQIAQIAKTAGISPKRAELLYHQLIYFDGNHSKKATLEYFELLLPTITNQTIWIFDDIHWSSEMEEAWEIIKNNPKVTVSIDTFQWGLVFFRYEQPKQHFIIRI